MQFLFDIRKAIAATGILCELNGGKLDILPLIKMLYLADRKALLEWNRTITGDSFFSMRHGPILSRIYDLMNDRVMGGEMDLWRETFNPREGHSIAIKKAVERGPLSRREIEALTEAHQQLSPMSASALIKFVHELPEWTDPANSSKPIDPRTILFDAGMTEEEIREIEEELELHQLAKSVLQAS